MTEENKIEDPIVELMQDLIAAAEDGTMLTVSERLYEMGWRKQSEWISVEERLPEKEGRYLVYGVIGGQPLVCGAHYDKHNGFGDDDFTHWMPLPEPPKPER